SASDLVGEYAPAMTEDGHILHFIREGETLSGIAAQYEIERQDILFANGFRPDVQLFAGDQIIVPQGEFTPQATATLPPLDVAETSELALAPTTTAIPTESGEPSAPEATPTPRIHTVQAGEVAGRIANQYNITVASLAAMNPGANMERLS